MATTIHSLAYKITADTVGMTRGLTATRKELSAAKRQMKEVETPLERFNREVRESATLLGKGAISLEQHRRKVEKLKAEYNGAGPAVNRFQSAVGKLRGGVSGLTAALGPAGLAAGALVGALGGAAIKTARVAVDKITENMEKLDRVGKLSAAIGIKGQELRRLQLVAATISGVDGEKLGKALQFMVNAVSEAAMGLGEGKGAIEELGLSAESLNLRPPQEQFRILADAIRSVKNENDQARIAQDLFGRGGKELVATLRAGSGEIDRLAEVFDKFAGTISEFDLSNIQRLNDELGLARTAAEGLFEQLTAEVSIPALGVIRELNRQIAGRDADRQGVRGTAGLTVASVAQNAAGFAARRIAGSFGGRSGAVGESLVGALLQRIPSVIDLAVKAQEETTSQSVRNTQTIVQGLARVEAAARESGVAIESPPGSR